MLKNVFLFLIILAFSLSSQNYLYYKVIDDTTILPIKLERTENDSIIAVTDTFKYVTGKIKSIAFPTYDFLTPPDSCFAIVVAVDRYFNYRLLGEIYFIDGGLCEINAIEKLFVDEAIMIFGKNLPQTYFQIGYDKIEMPENEEEGDLPKSNLKIKKIGQ